MTHASRTTVLFVCLGNICRSPLAKAIFVHRARERRVLERVHADSCGTGHWHVGGPADPRSVLVAQRHGVAIEHVARQVAPARDFREFQWIIAMDRRNQADLLSLGAPADRTRLMRSFDPQLAGARGEELDVPDPYTGSDAGFQLVYEMLDAANAGLLDMLLAAKL